MDAGSDGTGGGAMVAVDTLVHNWLWRTGIMRRLGKPHLYGGACYGERGCEEIVNRVSRRIDARRFDPNFRGTFPCFVRESHLELLCGIGLRPVQRKYH